MDVIISQLFFYQAFNTYFFLTTLISSRHVPSWLSPAFTPSSWDCTAFFRWASAAAFLRAYLFFSCSTRSSWSGLWYTINKIKVIYAITLINYCHDIMLIGYKVVHSYYCHLTTNAWDCRSETIHEALSLFDTAILKKNQEYISLY